MPEEMATIEHRTSACVHLNLQTFGVMCGFTTYATELSIRLAEYSDIDADIFYFSLRQRKNTWHYDFPIRHIHSLETFVFRDCSRRKMPDFKFMRPFVSFNFLTGGKSDDIYVFFDGKIPALPIKGRIIAAIHDVIPFRMQVGGMDRAIITKNIEDLLRSEAVIITVSEFSRQDIAEYLHIDPNRIHVVPNGVDPSKFSGYYDSGHITAKYGLPEKYILYFGSCGTHKNVESLVKSYALLPSAVRNEYRLVITNPSDSVKACADACGVSGHVQYLYRVPDADKPGIYRGASLFVWPSLYEGFGIPILEAQASGVPVVSSNAGVMPEVTGDSAVLADPKDTEAIASAIQRVLTDEALRRDLVMKGFENIKRFSWDESAKKLHDIILSL